MAVANRKNLGDVLPNTVDDAIVADPCLANVFAPDFRNDTANKRKQFKMRSCSEHLVLPVPRCLSIAAFLCDVSDDGGAAEAAAL